MLLFRHQLVHRFRPRRRRFLHLADQLSQLDLAPRNHIHKPDAQKVPAIAPFHDAAEAKRNSRDFEEDLDLRPGARGQLLPGAQTAALHAQIHNAAWHRYALAHEQHNGIFVYRVAWIGTALLWPRREAFPVLSLALLTLA